MVAELVTTSERAGDRTGVVDLAGEHTQRLARVDRIDVVVEDDGLLGEGVHTTEHTTASTREQDVEHRRPAGLGHQRQVVDVVHVETGTRTRAEDGNRVTEGVPRVLGVRVPLVPDGAGGTRDLEAQANQGSGRVELHDAPPWCASRVAHDY